MFSSRAVVISCVDRQGRYIDVRRGDK